MSWNFSWWDAYIKPAVKKIVKILPGNYSEISQNLGTLSGTQTVTIDLNDGNTINATVQAGAVIDFIFPSDPPSGQSQSFVLKLTNGGTGTVTWPVSNFSWLYDQAPTLQVSGDDYLIFINTGNSWVGSLNSSVLLDTYQPIDATLTALAGVSTSADKIIYATGSDAFSTTDLTAVSRTLLSSDSYEDFRNTLELGTSATQPISAFRASLPNDVNIQDVTGDITIDKTNATFGKTYQFLNPTANRTVDFSIGSSQYNGNIVHIYNTSASNALITGTGHSNPGQYIYPKNYAILRFVYVDGINDFWQTIYTACITSEVSIGVGARTVPTGKGVSIGENTNGNGGVSIGAATTTTSTYEVAVGRGATTSSIGGVAIGYFATASAGGICIGQSVNDNGKYYPLVLGYNGSAKRAGEATRSINIQSLKSNSLLLNWSRASITGDGSTYAEILPQGIVVFTNTYRNVISSNSMISFTGNASYIKSDGSKGAAWRIEGSILNSSGTTTLKYLNIFNMFSDDASYDITITADDTNDALVLKLKQPNGEVGSIAAEVHATEVWV